MNSEIIMHQTEDGLTKIETTFDGDTVWLSIDHMAIPTRVDYYYHFCRL